MSDLRVVPEPVEPEYLIVQPGLGGVAWLGEVVDGEPSPIAKIQDLLTVPDEPTQQMIEAFKAGWHQADMRGLEGRRVELGLLAVLAVLKDEQP